MFSQATQNDLVQRPSLIFEKVLANIANCISGLTVLAIKRNWWLFVKAGWDVRFVPARDRAYASVDVAAIVAFPIVDN